MTTYKCPMCGVELGVYEGKHPTHPNLPEKMTAGSVYLYCNNLSCKAQEVLGSGKNIKEAYEIVVSKYTPRKEKATE